MKSRGYNVDPTLLSQKKTTVLELGFNTDQSELLLLCFDSPMLRRADKAASVRCREVQCDDGSHCSCYGCESPSSNLCIYFLFGWCVL